LSDVREDGPTDQVDNYDQQQTAKTNINYAYSSSTLPRARKAKKPIYEVRNFSKKKKRFCATCFEHKFQLF